MLQITICCLTIIGICGQASCVGTNQKPAFIGQTRITEQKLNVGFDIVTVAEGLKQPWGIAFLPDSRILVTERAGRLRIITPDGKMSEPVAGLPSVDARSQGGLLGLALDPNFASNQIIYWSYAEPNGDRTNNTAVARGKLIGGGAPRLENVQVIFHQTPSLNLRSTSAAASSFAATAPSLLQPETARSPRAACRHSVSMACLARS